MVAAPRESGGEEVVAAVVLRDGAELDVEALRDFCRTRLAGYKVPRRIVAVDDLPRYGFSDKLVRLIREGFPHKGTYQGDFHEFYG